MFSEDAIARALAVQIFGDMMSLATVGLIWQVLLKASGMEALWLMTVAAIYMPFRAV
jgi:hypothetical protein